MGFLVTRIGKSTTPVDIVHHASILAFSVMMTLTFSLSPTEEEAIRIIRTVRKSQRVLGVFSNIPWIYRIATLIPGFISHEFAAMTNEIIQKRGAIPKVTGSSISSSPSGVLD